MPHESPPVDARSRSPCWPRRGVRRHRLPPLLHRRRASRASGRARCSSARTTISSRRWRHVPWLVSLLADPDDARRLRCSPIYMYIVVGKPRRARSPTAIRCSTASCSTSGISTSSTTSCSCARRSGSGALFWKGGDGASSTASGRTASRRACSTSRAASCKLQTGYIYHYAFAMLLGVAALRHLVSVRRESADVRLLDPLRPADPAARRRAAASCCCAATTRRRSDNARWIALWHDA